MNGFNQVTSDFSRLAINHHAGRSRKPGSVEKTQENEDDIDNERDELEAILNKTENHELVETVLNSNLL